MWSNLLLYGLTHALVDFTSVGTIFLMQTVAGLDGSDSFHAVVFYNLFAFALQPFVGLLADRVKRPRGTAAAGCACVAGAALALFCYRPGTFALLPWIIVALAGVGNAVFHVGAGIICLNLKPGHAGPAGIYVAPGAIGLSLGILSGNKGWFTPLVAAFLLGAAIFSMFLVRPPTISSQRTSANKDFGSLFCLALVLLLISIAIRSLGGFAISMPWKSDLWLLALLTGSIALGKALGGIIGDRFGWSRVTSTALVLSAPLLAFGALHPYFAIPGMFLFNMAMPITLVAVVAMFPGRNGFAFGLTCLALVGGALPTFYETKAWFSNPWAIFGFVLFAALSIAVGIGLLRKKNVLPN